MHCLSKIIYRRHQYVAVWTLDKNVRYIEKLADIILAKNLSDRIWIHETHQGINFHY
jgi:hypothetical protein